MRIAGALLFTGLFALSCNAQELSAPESAAVDARTGRTYISNYGNGTIVQIDSAGEKTIFKQDVSRPLGMLIHDDVLFVVSNPDRVLGFRLPEGRAESEFVVEGALFLNDVTCDSSGFLYVTDSRGGTVHRIDPAHQKCVLFARTRLDNPNGILHDPVQNRLLICYFSDHGAIDAVSLADTVCSMAVQTELDNLDGLAMDRAGNVYVSSWAAGSFQSGFERRGAVWKYDNGFRQNPVLIADGLYGPADIFIDMHRNDLIIPLFLDNQITLMPLSSH
ncbi:SMP-30/gluconolactonase/LRE family protein [bacterium]|nr:SMP-30/gluconolactonase/LRE family protein [bacterium]